MRKHKGIFELIELLDRLNDPRCKLLVVGSRETPDLRKVSAQHRDSVVILPPQPPARLAPINLAADEDPRDLCRSRGTSAPPETRARLLRAGISYRSVLPAFALGASGLERDCIYPAAGRFADFFAEFKKRAQEPGR